jgi:hypothetical protein
MEVFLVYLWLKLDTFSGITGTISTLAIIFGVIFTVFAGIARVEMRNDIEEDRNSYLLLKKGMKIFLTAALIFGTTHTLLPSSKETAVLVGTHYAVQLANSPEGQKVGSLIRKKANEFLDEQLKEAAK